MKIKKIVMPNKEEKFEKRCKPSIVITFLIIYGIWYLLNGSWVWDNTILPFYFIGYAMFKMENLFIEKANLIEDGFLLYL